MLLIVFAVAVRFGQPDRFSWLLLSGVPLIVAAGSISQFSRIEIDGNSFTVVSLWRTRRIDMADLRGISYRPSGRAGSCLLTTPDGRFKVSMTTFDHDDLWKPLILQKADRLGAPVTERAREALQHTDGTGRGWLA